MKTFKVAATHENFRKASELLYLSQPAITKHIKQLESYLNIQLFDRKGRSVVLNEAGQQFLPSAIRILSQYEKEIEGLESWKQGYERKLIIAVAPQIAISVLPAILSEFMLKHPQIEVIFNVLKSYEIGTEVATKKADIGLTKLSPLQHNIRLEQIFEEQVVLVSQNIGGITLSEMDVLKTKRLITYEHSDYFEELLGEIRAMYSYIRVMKINQVEIIKKMVEQGLGVSYLPVTVVKEELQIGSLVQIKADKILPKISATYLVTQSVQTREAALFIGFLKSKFQ